MSEAGCWELGAGYWVLVIAPKLIVRLLITDY